MSHDGGAGPHRRCAARQCAEKYKATTAFPLSAVAVSTSPAFDLSDVPRRSTMDMAPSLAVRASLTRIRVLSRTRQRTRQGLADSPSEARGY